ncbi:hypothetical protein JVU11DRAFT_7605 [Chiua virens]|nr:hypothetical protein JVU11DRAFT_7605 [Chiua virens]
MIPNHLYIPHPTHPSSQATPLVLPSTYHTSQAAPTGAPHSLQPTHANPQATPSVVPTLGNTSLAVYSSTFPYDARYNNNWGPTQEHLFLQHATQMTGVGGPSTTGWDPQVHHNSDTADYGLWLFSRQAAPLDTHHYQCLWGTNGIICSHVAIDFDELMLHLGRVHDVQGTAARKIDCQWLTERGICGMQYRRDGFRRHIGTHLGLSVPCIHCGKSFSREDSLRAHIKKCHEKLG